MKWSHDRAIRAARAYEAVHADRKVEIAAEKLQKQKEKAINTKIKLKREELKIAEKQKDYDEIQRIAKELNKAKIEQRKLAEEKRVERRKKSDERDKLEAEVKKKRKEEKKKEGEAELLLQKKDTHNDKEDMATGGHGGGKNWWGRNWGKVTLAAGATAAMVGGPELGKKVGWGAGIGTERGAGFITGGAEGFVDALAPDGSKSRVETRDHIHEDPALPSEEGGTLADPNGTGDSTRDTVVDTSPSADGRPIVGYEDVETKTETVTEVEAVFEGKLGTIEMAVPESAVIEENGQKMAVITIIIDGEAGFDLCQADEDCQKTQANVLRTLPDAKSKGFISQKFPVGIAQFKVHGEMTKYYFQNDLPATVTLDEHKRMENGKEVTVEAHTVNLTADNVQIMIGGVIKKYSEVRK